MPKKTTKSTVIAKLQKVDGIGPQKAETLYNKCGGKDCINRILDADASEISELTNVSLALIEQLQNDLEPKAFGSSPIKHLCSTKDREELRCEFTRNWESLSRQREYCELVLSKHRNRLLARPDVNGIHVGLWRQGDNIVHPLEYCIRVHVAKKLQLTNQKSMSLDANSLMPTAIERMLDGVRVDICEGSYTQTMALPDHVAEAKKVMKGGVAISPVQASDKYGTLGIPVRQNGRTRYLTNRHVVGDHKSLVQHPPTESGTSGSIIGKVAPNPTLDKEIDAALVLPAPQSPPSEFSIGDEGGFVYRDLHDFERFDVELLKVGANTKKTIVGQFKDLNATVIIKVPLVGGGMMTHTMNNQILVESSQSTPISDFGDSGSVLFLKGRERGENFVVGLIHAKADDGNGLVACHIRNVLKKFSLEGLQ